jgi:MFS family permease
VEVANSSGDEFVPNRSSHIKVGLMSVLAAILPYLLVAALVVTVVVVFAGVFGMALGGRFNDRYGNKLMRLRVAAQGAAVVLLGLIMALSYVREGG